VDLNDLRYFVEVVNKGSFSAAGRALEHPTSTVSFRITRLERELNLKLLARSSRRVAMTPAGEEFYDHASAMIERITVAERAMRNRLSEPAGPVRYTVAVGVAQFAMTEMVLAFMKQHPKVELIQHASDTNVDIVADGYDFAIRAHTAPLPDSNLIQRPLAKVPWRLYASPAYFDDTSVPQIPDDLEGRDTLFMKRDNVMPIWHLHKEADPETTVQVVLRPRFRGPCIVTLKKAAEDCFGIVALPAYVCRQEVRAGSLRRVLPDWVAADSSITALMPGRGGLTAAARAFIDHLARHFSQAVKAD
jgi:DNA-binding transcriptional LysR family regulator